MFEAVLYVETLSAAAMRLMVVEKKGEKNGRLELGMSDIRGPIHCAECLLTGRLDRLRGKQATVWVAEWSVPCMP